MVARGKIVDIWFQTDTNGARYTSDIVIDPEILKLPMYGGIGLLPSLPRAASQDIELENLLHRFSELIPTNGAEGAELDPLVEQILFQWVGASELDPDSRGVFIDSRKVAFMESFFGSYINDRNGNLDHIGSVRARALSKIYDEMKRAASPSAGYAN